MSFGTLMQFVREHWGAEHAPRNGSILVQLYKRWGERDTEAMVRGAALLGWQDLRAINANDGIGRRWAMAKYWDSQKRAPGNVPESVKAIFRQMGAE